MIQPKPMEVDQHATIAHARLSVGATPRFNELADSAPGSERLIDGVRRGHGGGPGALDFRRRLTADDPGLAAVPAVAVVLAMGIEHDGHSLGQLMVDDFGIGMKRGVAARRIGYGKAVWKVGF